MESNGPHGCSGHEPVQLVQIRPRPLGRVRFDQVCDPLILELERSLDATRVLSRALDVAAYASDASFYRLVPRAVVQPTSEAEIQRLFSISRQHQVPLCFRAAGTSLSGQSVTDGILVDLSKHWSAIEVLGRGECVRIGPGAIGARVNAELLSFSRRIGPDPASIDACMMGGILANNASGMCCGVAENAYQTLVSIRLMLSNGVVLDTSEPDADDKLRAQAPLLYQGLARLRDQVRGSELLQARIRSKYRIKNTTGYALNALLDYHRPSDILAHLMIGSEGTLGFIASAVLRTLPDYPVKSTGLLLFGSSDDAFSSVPMLAASGARAVEFMDSASLRAVATMPELSDRLRSKPAGASALLVEYQCESVGELAEIYRAHQEMLQVLPTLETPSFSQEPKVRAGLWKIRKGLFPSVGATKKSGETAIIEDVAFPLDAQAKAVSALRAICDKHGYVDAIMFGHAKDGNCHFVIKQSFNDPKEVSRYARLMDDVVALVVHHGGSLKAEHGTGRNMAPFVEIEWGQQAHELMREIKKLADPDGILNPGVIINDDPHAHLKNLKNLPAVESEIDRCIECGFCEPNCPSRRLSLSPRQRIAARREMARLRAQGATDALSSMLQDYQYLGVDTCAADGLCAAACPVKIDTGVLTKRLRSESNSSRARAVSLAMARHLKWIERAARMALRMAHLAERVVGASRLARVSTLLERVLGVRVPAWSSAIPYVPSRALPASWLGHPQYIYVPSCLSRMMGQPRTSGSSLIECVLRLSDKAQVRLWLPPHLDGECCGLPFGSKGFSQAHALVLERLVGNLWEWSRKGRIPIVTDASSCLYSITTSGAILSEEAQQQLAKMQILDLMQYAAQVLVPRLSVERLDRKVVLHPNCAGRKLGIDASMREVASACAKQVVVPLELSCCATAGDRGFLYPELRESALARERREVLAAQADGFYSNNLTCEMGMTEAMGVTYSSLIYLLEEAAEQGAYGAK